MFINFSAAIFAVTGVVLYAIDLSEASLLWMCDASSYYLTAYQDNCRYVARLAQVSLILQRAFKAQSVTYGMNRRRVVFILLDNLI